MLLSLTRPRAVGRMARSLVAKAAGGPQYAPLPPSQKVG